MEIFIGISWLLVGIGILIFSILNIINAIGKSIYFLVLSYMLVFTIGLYIFTCGLNLLFEIFNIKINLEKIINTLYKMPIIVFLIIWIGMIVFFIIKIIEMQQFVFLLFMIPFIAFTYVIIKKLI